MERLKREFIFNDNVLPDPNPNISPEEVKEIYANEYPELITANVFGPDYRDDKAIYEFKSSFKPKA